MERDQQRRLEREAKRVKKRDDRSRILSALNAAGQLVLDGKWDQARTAYGAIGTMAGVDPEIARDGAKEAAKALTGMDAAVKVRPAVTGGAKAGDAAVEAAGMIAKAADAEWKAKFDLEELRATRANELRKWPYVTKSSPSIRAHAQTLFWLEFVASDAPIAAVRPETIARQIKKDTGAAIQAYQDALKLPGIRLFSAGLESTDERVRRGAAQDLLDLGPGAIEALPDLVKALKDESKWVRSRALDALLAIGPGAKDAAAAMIQAAQAMDNSRTLEVVIGAVAEMDLTDPSLLPVLIEVRVGSSSSIVSKALVKLDPTMETVVPALIKILSSDPQPDRRINAMWALRDVGPGAKAALPAVMTVATQDKVNYVRSSAVRILGMIDSSGEQCVPALIQALADEDTNVRTCAAGAFGGMGPAAKPAIPALIGVLTDKDFEARRRAAIALGELGPAAQAAVPVLIKVKEDSRSGQYQRAIARAIEAIQR